MKRGDLITVAPQGDYGKPRPAVVIQSDSLDAADSVLVVLLTSALADTPFYRLTVGPSGGTGLRSTSQIMVDKILAYPRAKCGPVIGHLADKDILVLNNMLSVMIGLAD